ncbi:MAG: (2Fe-2S)-binding protein [Deltaproteobacteria bacterium]|jgi:carbon-monoxide dehydrogenase small subunit|nr:(2Fe-2S)-binding protein [Deltaproteobacteria bacterium]
MRTIKVTVNGESHQAEVPDHRTLLDFLRQDLELMGTKSGCETGDCGACTVLLNGKAVNSCLVLAAEADGKEVLTVEGLAYPNRELHPLQEAFVEHGAIQCGYCTSGMLLSAKALLDEIPRPTEEEVKEALAGNLCRCTGYYSIIKAVQAAAEKMNR